MLTYHTAATRRSRGLRASTSPPTSPPSPTSARLVPPPSPTLTTHLAPSTFTLVTPTLTLTRRAHHPSP